MWLVFSPHMTLKVADRMWMYTAATAPCQIWPCGFKDCAMFAGEDRDWAMCHVGEKYQHLSLCSEGFGSLKEALWRLII